MMSEHSSDQLHPHDDDQRTYILVTGANSGLGLAICRRIIDDFVHSRPAYQSLTLVITVRGPRKAKETVDTLRKHLNRKSKELETTLDNRVTLQPENLDLSTLNTVQILASKLCKSIPHLDALILNAGSGGLIGLNWFKAIWHMVSRPVEATTYPAYKLSSLGELTPPQQPLDDASDSEKPSSSPSPPPLGQVFTTNILGHYILSHLLTPLFSSSPENGRIIFVSSIEAYPWSFTSHDIQALSHRHAYESSKRLSDLLVLTSSLPSTSPFTTRFLTPPASASSTPTKPGIHLNDNAPTSSTTSLPSTRITLTDSTSNAHQPRKPALLLSHPGICATSFFPLPLILFYSTLLVFYLARLLGSPWANVTAYRGAAAPTWLALASREEIEDMETEGGKGKWGSATTWWGKERVVRTGVGGWGTGGRVGDTWGVGGRKGERIAEGEKGELETTLSKESREGFEETGREAWKQMEELRVFWEGWVRGEE